MALLALHSSYSVSPASSGIGEVRLDGEPISSNADKPSILHYEGDKELKQVA